MDYAAIFMDCTNSSIGKIIESNCSYEEPWDGFGGLVRVGDSALFREEGLLTTSAPFQSSSSHESNKPKSSKSRASTPSNPARSLEEKRVSTSNMHTPVLNSALKDSPTETPVSTIANLGNHGNEDTASDADVVGGLVSKCSTPVHRFETFGSRGSDRRSTRSRLSNTRSNEPVSESRFTQHNLPTPITVEHAVSDVEKFKSRLVAVRSEGLPAKLVMLKCAAIAEDAFQLSLRKLKNGDFADSYLLAEVAENACPTSTESAKTKIQKLKEALQRRLKSSSLVV